MANRFLWGLTLSGVLLPPLLVCGLLFVQHSTTYRPTGTLVLIAVFGGLGWLPVVAILKRLQPSQLRIVGVSAMVFAVLVISSLGYGVEFDAALAARPSSTGAVALPFMVVYGFAGGLIGYGFGVTIERKYRRDP